MKLSWKISFLLALALALGVLPASAQRKPKNPPPAATDDSNATPSLPMSDTQKIDETISEMLGYWQIGMVDQMKKYYSPDVIVVSGAFEPPISGWDAYAKAYQAQRARIQGGQLDRTNTLIKVEGATAWATYQWEYFAVIDQAQHDVRGHTTLVLEKQGDDWVIALDHTSVVTDTLVQQSAPAQPPVANPAPTPH
jgi:ketosteroid isomerase-like protein